MRTQDGAWCTAQLRAGHRRSGKNSGYPAPQNPTSGLPGNGLAARTGGGRHRRAARAAQKSQWAPADIHSQQPARVVQGLQRPSLRVESGAALGCAPHFLRQVRTLHSWPHQHSYPRPRALLAFHLKAQEPCQLVGKDQRSELHSEGTYALQVVPVGVTREPSTTLLSSSHFGR